MRKGWEYKKLGEVATYINGYAFKPDQWKESGTPIIRIQNLNNPNAPYNYFDGEVPDKVKIQNGDLLISWSASLGAYIWNGGKAFLNQHIFKVAFDKTDIDKFFLKYAVTSKLAAMAEQVHGATMKHIVKKDFDNTLIPYPPLSTQLAIVSELDKIKELIRLKKEQLKDFDNLAQSLFYEMFGDPVENEKGWEVKKLKDISREIGDGLHGTPEYSEVDTGCYFINGNNLENGTIVIKENTKMVSEKTKAKHYIEMDDFTILVSINGTLGKVAFYNGENVILGKSACYIKLEAYNDKKYIFELLKSDYFKRYAESECTGTTIRNVSLKSMRNFRCLLPPLPLQRLFAQRIEQIEREKSEVQKSIQDLETLLASRMQYWFE